MEKEKRRYSGQSFEDRQSDRRERLIHAALVVAGRFGLEGASVAAICAEAELTARYFYESFPNREAIFVEAYRLAQAELLGRMGEVAGRKAPVESALAGFFSALNANPGLARVFLLDLDDHGPAMRAASEEGAAKLAKAFVPAGGHPLLLAGILGAIVDIAKRWIASGFTTPVEEVVAIALPFTRVTSAPSKATRKAR
ncbi:MAG TPA: TetR/AcrR family transcriptional regulator [Rhizomicrobium sp.]|jgi:AcrR family transcriptional regulator